MTHPNESYSESNPFDEMVQVLDAHSFDDMAVSRAWLGRYRSWSTFSWSKTAMKIQRSEVLGAGPYERANKRRG